MTHRFELYREFCDTIPSWQHPSRCNRRIFTRLTLWQRIRRIFA